ncbi:cupin domain-containing protein [Lentzea sp. NPDC051208]|uniref:cupin domain-containing protein n=1 Tax=Lentzea sp. NPDC051208 TaxID=3154642 RepID=UPI00343B5D6F
MRHLGFDGEMMTFKDFPADPADPYWEVDRAIIVPADEGKTVVINGDVFTVKLRSAVTTGSLGFIEADVPPGIGASPHAHLAEDEAFYLVSGEMDIINGNTTQRCGAGDFIFIPRGTRHGYRNVGEDTAKLLVFFTPGGAEELWLEVGEEATKDNIGVPWSDRQFEAIAEPLKRYHMPQLPGGAERKR